MSLITEEFIESAFNYCPSDEADKEFENARTLEDKYAKERKAILFKPKLSAWRANELRWNKNFDNEIRKAKDEATKAKFERKQKWTTGKETREHGGGMSALLAWNKSSEHGFSQGGINIFSDPWN